MFSTISQSFGSKHNRNTIVIAAIVSIAVWLALGATSAASIGLTQVTIASIMFGMLGVIIISLVKFQNIQGIGKYYGMVTSVLCVFMLFIWLESTTRVAVSLSFLVLGFVLVSYIEITKSIYDL